MRSEILIHPEELSKRWIDRMAGAGIRVLGVHPVGGSDAADSLSALLRRLDEADFRALLDYAAQQGLEIEYECHAAGYLMPRALFAAHPDYFRMAPDGTRKNDFNFCVSNEEALTLYARRAAQLAHRLYRSSHSFYFWMDDQKGSRCHCPKCRDLSASDQQLIVINRVVQELRKSIPDAKAAYLAYFDCVGVPGKVKPAEGVFLEYAPFEKYTATGVDAPRLIQNESQMLKPLLEFFGSQGAKVLEYWYDNSMLSHWKKPPRRFTLRREEMERDIRDYRARGFRSIATFGCYLGADYEERYGEPDITPFARATAE